jgi:hypothetical protein
LGFHVDGWEQFQPENSNDDGIGLVNFTAPLNAVMKARVPDWNIQTHFDLS